MKNTIKFVAVCVAAPVMALGVAAPTAWADCKTSCTVGGAAPGSTAEGGYVNGPLGSASGTGAPSVIAVGVNGAGHFAHPPGTPFGPGTASGNFNTIPSSKGHCTGTFTGACS